MDKISVWLKVQERGEEVAEQFKLQWETFIRYQESIWGEGKGATNPGINVS